MSIIDAESSETVWCSRELADSKDADREFLAFHRSGGIEEYLVQMKIFQAQRLLGDSRLTIQQISQRMGFSSPAYFSRLLRARTSESAHQFRQRVSCRGE